MDHRPEENPFASPDLEESPSGRAFPWVGFGIASGFSIVLCVLVFFIEPAMGILLVVFAVPSMGRVADALLRQQRFDVLDPDPLPLLIFTSVLLMSPLVFISAIASEIARQVFINILFSPFLPTVTRPEYSLVYYYSWIINLAITCLLFGLGYWWLLPYKNVNSEALPRIGVLPAAGRWGIWGTVAIAAVVSLGSFVIHPVWGLTVLIASVAAVARTAVVASRTERQSEFDAKTVLSTFGGSFISMGMLLIGSLLAKVVISVALTRFFVWLNLGEVGELAGALMGFLVGGIVLGVGFWSWLPERKVAQKNRAVE